jgi:hypothetical protein
MSPELPVECQARGDGSRLFSEGKQSSYGAKVLIVQLSRGVDDHPVCSKSLAAREKLVI